MKPVESLSDDELFSELREQVTKSRNGGNNRDRTRKIAAEMTFTIE